MKVHDQIRRDVGQLLWIGFEGTTLPGSTAEAIAAGDVGAVILFGRNLPTLPAGQAATATAGHSSAAPAGQTLTDLDALAALNAALHGAVGKDCPPLWISVDQEGGRVQRVRAPATVWPPMLSFKHLLGAGKRSIGMGEGGNAGELGDAGAELAGLAEEVGEAMGRELWSLGFDVDFAPVLDVHTNPANPVIGDRAFATDPEEVARFALAFARGLARSGVIACGKHFPGHGDTSTDSHLELPRLDHDLSRLRSVELVPFERAAAAGVPLIMTAHVIFAALDAAVPATLSKAVITGLLRQELGYQGIVVSDDLDMRAIADHFGIGDAAVRAIAAGCDALLLCRNPDHQREAREALCVAAARNGEISSRVAESAARIRAAKTAHEQRTRGLGRAPGAACGHPSHRAIADRLRGL